MVDRLTQLNPRDIQTYFLQRGRKLISNTAEYAKNNAAVTKSKEWFKSAYPTIRNEAVIPAVVSFFANQAFSGLNYTESMMIGFGATNMLRGGLDALSHIREGARFGDAIRGLLIPAIEVFTIMMLAEYGDNIWHFAYRDTGLDNAWDYIKHLSKGEFERLVHEIKGFNFNTPSWLEPYTNKLGLTHPNSPQTPPTFGDAPSITPTPDVGITTPELGAESTSTIDQISDGIRSLYEFFSHNPSFCYGPIILLSFGIPQFFESVRSTEGKLAKNVGRRFEKSVGLPIGIALDGIFGTASFVKNIGIKMFDAFVDAGVFVGGSISGGRKAVEARRVNKQTPETDDDSPIYY